jgi:hypothetical protein
MTDIILKWQVAFGIQDWNITTKRINPDQVTYIEEVPLSDRYFIGIQPDFNTLTAVIYHDRDLYEEAIIHELLHVRYPSKTEEWIDSQTTKIYSLETSNVGR